LRSKKPKPTAESPRPLLPTFRGGNVGGADREMQQNGAQTDVPMIVYRTYGDIEVDNWIIIGFAFDFFILI